VPEKKIPWWQKALHFALDTIRSGFGLFSHPAEQEHGSEPEFSDCSEENSEEETALTDSFPKSEIAAVTPPIAAEIVAETAMFPAAAPEAVAEPASVPVSEPTAAPVEAEPEEAAAPEAMNESVPEPIETVVEAESEFEANAVPEPIAALAVEQAETSDESSTEPESLPIPESELAAQPETEPEIIPLPAEAVAEQEAAEISEPEADSEPEIVNEFVPEPVEAVETLTDAESTPEAVNEPVSEQTEEAEAESFMDAEPGPASEPVPESASASDAVAALVLTPEPTAAEAAAEKADERAAAKQVAQQKKRDESSAQSPFSVVVGQVYDGPLDLLLDLIRKQDIDIYDIPIAKITSQFLAYVNQLKASDMDVAGEFIYTASLLIHIKSKMLLPREAKGPDDAGEDPRQELVERLLEHERFKEAAQMLQQKQMLEAATWSNPGISEFQDDVAAEPEIAADTVDLVRVFRDILERARKRPAFNVQEDSVTVGQMIQFLARRLTMEDKPVALHRLLSHTRSERALIAMFLALLELVRLQAVLLRQDRAFSEIFIKKHTNFDAAMNESLANAGDDWR
jgi:segregation and condensation protein A